MKKYFIVLGVSIVSFIAIFFNACETKQTKLTIGFVGDILLDRGVREQMELEGQAHFYAQIQKEIPELDYLIGNLECPITSIHSPIYKKYVFRGDTTNTKYLRQMGITHLTVANNHSYDQGRKGLEATIQNLQKHHIRPMGYGKSLKTACEPTIIEEKAVKIILYSSVFLPLENWMPLENEYNVCQENYQVLAEKIRQTKVENPKAFVIVNLHWGTEHIKDASPYQRQQAHHLIDAGTDIIIGHHPHVVQPKETYKGKEIYYSIGNFIFDQRKPANQESLLVKVIIENNILKTEKNNYFIQNCKPKVVD